jgi:hypothetical protein
MPTGDQFSFGIRVFDSNGTVLDTFDFPSATAAKHFAPTQRKPITSSATSHQGYGMGRYGKGGYGVGEESIKVALNDGTRFSALELVQGVLGTWQSFFAKHGI